MSFTTSFFGGGPVCLGTAGFAFVSFRFVDALGAGGALGAGPAGMSAVVALPPPPPHPATAIAAAASRAGRWMRLTDRQASEPGYAAALAGWAAWATKSLCRTSTKLRMA